MTFVLKTPQSLECASCDELILVVERTKLFPFTAWHGIYSQDLDRYLALIQEHKMFIPRAAAENDQRFKQIIPYVTFMYQDQVFMVQRSDTASEQRLKNKFSIGIGGHIQEIDMQKATIFDWAQREFHEEVHYYDTVRITPLGLLNDDTDSVGQVHLGLVLLAEGNSSNISIKSELKTGRLCSLQECLTYKDLMESWSKTVLDTLIALQGLSKDRS